jgi:excisionase family DNA binding protein
VQLPTVEETAELLQVGRDKVYYPLRTGQLRSIKIGKLRQVSRAWITEFPAARLSEDDPLYLWPLIAGRSTRQPGSPPTIISWGSQISSLLAGVDRICRIADVTASYSYALIRIFW